MSDLVMRSIHLTESEDAELRAFSRATGSSVDEIIRDAVMARLALWRTETDDSHLDADIHAALDSKWFRTVMMK